MKLKLQRHFTGNHFHLNDAIQIVDRPNTTPVGEDKKTLTFLALFTSKVTCKKMLFTSVVACATRTYLRMKDILQLCTNFCVCVPSRWIVNVWFPLVITASQWRNVLFDPYLFEAQPHYTVFCVSFFCTRSRLVPSHYQVFC